MAHLRSRHTWLITTTLAVVLVAAALVGLAHADVGLGGHLSLSAHPGGHASGQFALVPGSRGGSAGLSAELVLVALALSGPVSALRSRRGALSAPLGWHKLSSGLVPLPLRI